MGTVFTKEGIKKIRSRSNLSAKRARYRQLKERLLHPRRPDQTLPIKSATVQDLYQMKLDRKRRERSRKRFWLVFRISIVLLIFLSILVAFLT